MRRCFVNVDESENAFLHRRHRYGLSPEWVRMWVVTEEDWENLKYTNIPTHYTYYSSPHSTIGTKRPIMLQLTVSSSNGPTSTVNLGKIKNV